jgi:ribokinase
MTRVAVVGHVEWVEFVEVEWLPVEGEVLHAKGAFTRAAGGGGVAAVVLAGLGAEVHFFTALGRDDPGEAAAAELTAHGVRMHVAWRTEPTRRAWTLLKDGGERTIVTIGERLNPHGSDELEWELLRGTDGVYFTAGDHGALERSREAREVVATPRARDALEGDGPIVDALVFSRRDPEESEWAKRLARRARLLVSTDGANGGTWSGDSDGTWPAVAPPGPPRDTYGCGDSFAAGFTFGLASSGSVADAAAIGARCGADTLAKVGPP